MSGKGLIPKEFIDLLLSRIDIVDVINARVPLKKAGNSYKACCPFHQEKTPSFTVSQDKQVFHCFGCGASGTAVSFIMDFEQVDFPESIEILAHMEGMKIPYTKTLSSNPSSNNPSKETRLLSFVQQADLFFRQQLRTHPDKQRVINYLKNRGLSGEIAQQFGIGYAPNAWRELSNHLLKKSATHEELVDAGLCSQKDDKNTYDRFRDRIMFPIRDRKGQTIAFGGRILDQGEPKYLNSPETCLFHKADHLYGLYELRKNPNLRNVDHIIVVEGYMDVVMLANFGIFNTVATLGTATSKQHIEQLFKLVKKIVFCFDGDQAGKNAAWKALNTSLSLLKTGREVCFLFLPDKEDPDSLVKKEGKASFLERIQKADSLSHYLFNYLESSINLESIEGKASLLEQAGKLLNTMPDTPLRDLLRETLAQKTQASKHVLNKHSYRGAFNPPPQKASSKTVKKRTPIQRAIILLLNNPKLINELNFDFHRILHINVEGANILHQLLVLIKEHQWENASQIITYFEDQPTIQKSLLTLSQVPTISEKTLQRNELLDLFEKLNNHAQTQSDPVKLALKKMRNGETLTDDEVLLIQSQSLPNHD